MNKAKFLLERENLKFYLCLKHVEMERYEPGTLAHELPDEADTVCQFCRYDRMSS